MTIVYTFIYIYDHSYHASISQCGQRKQQSRMDE